MGIPKNSKRNLRQKVELEVDILKGLLNNWCWRLLDILDEDEADQGTKAQATPATGSSLSAVVISHTPLEGYANSCQTPQVSQQQQQQQQVQQQQHQQQSVILQHQSPRQNPAQHSQQHQHQQPPHQQQHIPIAQQQQSTRHISVAVNKDSKAALLTPILGHNFLSPPTQILNGDVNTQAHHQQQQQQQQQQQPRLIFHPVSIPSTSNSVSTPTSVIQNPVPTRILVQNSEPMTVTPPQNPLQQQIQRQHDGLVPQQQHSQHHLPQQQQSVDTGGIGLTTFYLNVKDVNEQQCGSSTNAARASTPVSLDLRNIQQQQEHHQQQVLISSTPTGAAAGFPAVTDPGSDIVVHQHDLHSPSTSGNSDIINHPVVALTNALAGGAENNHDESLDAIFPSQQLAKPESTTAGCVDVTGLAAASTAPHPTQVIKHKRRKPRTSDPSNTAPEDADSPKKSRYRSYMAKQCPLCSRVFHDSFGVRRHLNNVHFNLRSFPCNYCEQSYKTKETLNAHIRRKHSSVASPLPQASVVVTNTAALQLARDAAAAAATGIGDPLASASAVGDVVHQPSNLGTVSSY